ncbi:MAG: GAF domain-containing protein, partial [Dehalococcoidia bacterium]
MSPVPDSFYYLLSPLFIAAVSLGLAIVVLVVHGSRRNSSRWIFCALLLSVALYSFLIFGLRSSPDVHRALVWERAVTVASFIPYLLYYHFTVTYTGTSNKTQRRIVFASYLYLAIVSALVATDLLIKGMYIGEQGYFPILGPLVVPLTMVQLFWLGGGVYNFLKRYKVSRSSEERKRILYLTVAIFLPLAGAVSDAFTNLPPLAIWGNLMFCIICTIAIVKYHLLDIHIIIRRGAAYLLVSAAIATPYVAIILIVNHFFVGGLPVWTHFALLVFLALVLQPFWIRIQQVVDRWFYRDRYDYLRALEQFGHETRSIANPDELSTTLVKLVSGALRSTMTCLLLPSKDKSGLAVASCVGLDNPPPGVVIRQQGRLVKWLKLHGRILSSRELDFIPELRNLSEIERHNLDSLGAELYVPIRTRDNELCGVLVLGEKLSQQPYFDDDRQLLTTLINQMAMNLENSSLYDSERTMLKEVQTEAEQKTQFLHSVAHELKTPLTAIVSSSELLAEQRSIADSLKERLINNIRWSAASMYRRVVEL